MVVGRAELEASLARLAAEVVDARAGIHGPGSTAWRLERDGLRKLDKAVLKVVNRRFAPFNLVDKLRHGGFCATRELALELGRCR